MNSNQYQSRPSLPPIFPPPTTGDSSQLLAALHAQQQHRVNSPASLAALQERTLASNQNLNLGRNPHTGSPLPSINTWTSTGLSPIAMRPPPAATSSIPHHQQPFPRLNEQRPPSPPPVLEKPKPNLKRPRNKRVTAAQKKEMEEAAVESNGEAHDDGEEDIDEGPKKKGKRPSSLDANDKRKRQNRAAQRAFRERKEKHLRDLVNKCEAQDGHLDQYRTIYEQMSEEIAALRRGDHVPVQSYYPPAPHEASPPPGSRSPSPHPVAEAAVPPPPRSRQQQQQQRTIPAHPLAPIVSSELSLLREREERDRLMQTLSSGSGSSMSRGNYANSREGDLAVVGMGQAKMPISMERGQTPISRDGSTGSGGYRNVEYENEQQQRVGFGNLLDRGGDTTVASPLSRLYSLPTPSSLPATTPQNYQPQEPTAPLVKLENPSPMEDISFDFDAPFDFSFADSIPLPPLFQDIFDSSYQHQTTSSGAPTNGTNSHVPSPNPTAPPRPPLPTRESELDVDLCPIDTPEDFADPPPLPGGRLPCDKPECDFSIISCALPLPWRPSAIGGDVPSNSVWTAPVSWAKLCSHPMFGACDVDELCHELRDKTRCSDDGRLVITKADVCAVFRSIPARARTRRERIDLEGRRDS